MRPRLSGPALGLALAVVLVAGGSPRAQERIEFDTPIRFLPDAETADLIAGFLNAKQGVVLQSLGAAIENFESTVQFASALEAEPRYAQVFLVTTADQLTDYAIDRIKDASGSAEIGALLKYAKTLTVKLYEERQRAHEAQISHDAGAFLQQLRWDLANQPSDNEALLKTWIQDQLLGLPEDQRDGFRDELRVLLRELEVDAKSPPPGLTQLAEVGLYEKWINVHYQPTERRMAPQMSITGSDSGPGRIEILVGPGTGEASDRVRSAWPNAPYGDRMAGALNRALASLRNEGLDLGLIDLAVRKRVCFDVSVPGIFGDRTVTDCGLFDGDNELVVRPLFIPATQQMERVPDELWVERFFQES